MKKILVFALFCCLVCLFSGSAFAFEENILEVGVVHIKIDDGNKKHQNQEQTHSFIFYGSRDFFYVFNGIRIDLKNEGYKCSIEDVSSDTSVDLRVVMLCKKK